MSKLRLLIIPIILIYFSCNLISESEFSDKSINKSKSILFIGNSLTYTNNLPLLVKEHALSKGVLIETKMVAFPNYAISDHWNDGDIQKLIRSKKYDFVIIQQGPSSQNEGKEILIDYGKMYSDICKENNALLAFYMVWPSFRYYLTFDGVIKNYELAAEVNNAIVCPVGKVWKDYFDTTENFDYYGPDKFHPSVKGSKVAAQVIFDTLLKHIE